MSLTLKLKGRKVNTRGIWLFSVTLVTGLVRFSDRGILEAFEETVALDKEISHFQTFGMEVLILTA